MRALKALIQLIDMYTKDSKAGYSYGNGLLILLGALFVGLFLGSLAAAGIWMAMTDRSVLTMEKDILNPQYADVIRIIQLVSTFIIFFVPAWAAAAIINKKPFKLLGFNRYFGIQQVILTILITLATLPLVGALAEVNQLIPLSPSLEAKFKAMEDTYEEQVKVLSKISGWGEYVLSLLIMAIAPAIFEETFFRGGLQNYLQRLTKNPWITIGVTSVIFSAIHFSFYGFIPRVALGVMLGLLYYYSESLWLPIIAHCFNNALVVTQIYYLTMKGKPIEEAMKETYPIWWGAIALVVLYFLYKRFMEVAKRDLATRKPKEDLAVEQQWLS